MLPPPFPCPQSRPPALAGCCWRGSRQQRGQRRWRWAAVAGSSGVLYRPCVSYSACLWIKYKAAHGTARNVSSRAQSQHCERQQRRAARCRQRLPRNAPPAAAAGDAEQRLEACRRSVEEGRQQNANELKPTATEKTECCQLGGGGPARGPGCTLAAAPPSLPRLHPTTQHPSPPPSPAPRRAPSRQSLLACEVSQ